MQQSKMSREFEYGQADFEKVRGYLAQRAGIKLSDTKDALVYSRLARRIRALKLNSFASYLSHLDAHQDEFENFVNALTTNLTAFYREPHHFDALASFLEKRRGPVTIWCAASSTGEEPYSIAMTVANVYESFTTPVTIIASDIDSKVLATAKEGVYKDSALDKVPQHYRKQFFHRGTGVNSGKVKVVKELRNMVQFRQLNLTSKEWNIKVPLDVIFCRNVMIYFDDQTQIEVLTRMVKQMKPDGLYVAGHSENFNSQSHLVVPMGQTLYRPAKAS